MLNEIFEALLRERIITKQYLKKCKVTIKKIDLNRYSLLATSHFFTKTWHLKTR